MGEVVNLAIHRAQTIKVRAVGSRPSKIRRKPSKIGRASIKALNDLARQAAMVGPCLAWLSEIVRADPDPRAIAALLHDIPDRERLRSEINQTAAWLARLSVVLQDERRG
jgi:hypothetical protein